jgi:hypothetical protein
VVETNPLRGASGESSWLSILSEIWMAFEGVQSSRWDVVLVTGQEWQRVFRVKWSEKAANPMPWH